MAQPTIPLRNPRTAAFLAWLVPGLGHLYQGRVGKGILYATCILSLYAVGFAMGEGKIVYWQWVNPLNNPDKFCLYYLGQFFVGLPAFPALVQGTLEWFGMDPVFWGIMAKPPQNLLNGLHPRLSKLVEIGSMYTAVAGLLNVLAIYDAYEGPALVGAEHEPKAEGDAAPAAEPVLAGLTPEAPGVIPFAMVHVYWFVLPLVVAISLVYAATRHESWPRIWVHAFKLCTWILGILVLTTAILLLINTQV